MYVLTEGKRTKLKWLLQKLTQFEAQTIDAVTDYRSSHTEVPCYRLWPVQGEGAGCFMAVLKNIEAPHNEREPEGTLRNLIIRWNSE